MSEIIRSIEAKQLRKDIPEIAIGDTVRGQVKVVDPNGLLPAKPGLKVSFGPQVKGTVDVK